MVVVIHDGNFYKTNQCIYLCCLPKPGTNEPTSNQPTSNSTQVILIQSTSKKYIYITQWEVKHPFSSLWNDGTSTGPRLLSAIFMFSSWGQAPFHEAGVLLNFPFGYKGCFDLKMFSSQKSQKWGRFPVDPSGVCFVFLLFSFNKKCSDMPFEVPFTFMYTPEVWHSPWKMMVGRLLSFWESNFSGAMLNFRWVVVSSTPNFINQFGHIDHHPIVWCQVPGIVGKGHPLATMQVSSLLEVPGKFDQRFCRCVSNKPKKVMCWTYLLWYDYITCWGTKKIVLTPSHVGYEWLQPVSAVSAKMVLLFCPLMAKVSYLTIVQLSGVKTGATSHAIAHDFELPMVFDEWGPARWKQNGTFSVRNWSSKHNQFQTNELNWLDILGTSIVNIYIGRNSKFMNSISLQFPFKETWRHKLWMMYGRAWCKESLMMFQGISRGFLMWYLFRECCQGTWSQMLGDHNFKCIQLVLISFEIGDIIWRDMGIICDVI